MHLLRLGNGSKALELAECAAAALPPDLNQVGWGAALKAVAPALGSLLAALRNASLGEDSPQRLARLSAKWQL